MGEHDPRFGVDGNSGEGHRSHLLTPVMAGAIFQDDDVMGFLAGRLAFIPKDDIEAVLGWTGEPA